MGTGLEFTILGPLEVRACGELVHVGGPRQRALLGLLLCHANRVISRDELMEELLAGQPPGSAGRMLQVQVSRLRQALADGDGAPRLLARPPGYLLRVQDGELDLQVFEQRVAAGRRALEQGDPGQAAALLGEAESLWRGRPLADLEFEPFARFEIQRLEELRLLAAEDRIEAQLALGHHGAVCPELGRLVAEHPLRERLRGQLMLALYRSGRQAEALDTYRTGRSLLVEELGVEPGPGLRRVHQQMLAADPGLDLPAPAGERLLRALIESPYRGLKAFREQDAGVFFGREVATAQVLERMARLVTHPRVLVVSGASGAGKSSLLAAGVLPQVRGAGLAGAPEAASWPRVVFTPTRAPLDELALRVAPLAGTDAAAVRRGLDTDPAGFAVTARQAAQAGPGQDLDGSAERDQPRPQQQQQRLVLVVDQFEELFTQCDQEWQRRAFITALHAAASTGHGPGQTPAALVVLGVRADFEARCAGYPLLAGAIQDRYLVTAMTERQLRMAITEPAKQAGSPVDGDLVAALLAEVRAEPGMFAAGVLPLLSHALDQAWRSGTGAAVTLADYERTGLRSRRARPARPAPPGSGRARGRCWRPRAGR